MEAKDGCFRFEDFIVESPIGQGAFGQIYRATEIRTGNVYALKALNRRFLMKMKKQNQAILEKDALMKCNSPFIVNLYGTFKDASNLYFVLEFAEHGDLHEAVMQLGSLCTEVVSYLAAQLLMAICEMHAKGIIHRDIKPENVLLDKFNRIKLTDFGTAMICDTLENQMHASSIVGTPDFVAPELLMDGKICFSSDLWSFGCFMFDLFTGKAPFENDTPSALMCNISSRNIRSEIDTLPTPAKDLIISLLEIDPSNRLGFGENATGYHSIKSHPFFAKIDFSKLDKVTMPMFSPYEIEKPQSIAASMLNEGESIVYEGIVERRRIFSWKERVAVLTDQKRFMVFNIESHKTKTIINLVPSTKVLVSSNGKEWTLVWAPGKSQLFRCKDGNAGIWASMILKTLMY